MYRRLILINKMKTRMRQKLTGGLSQKTTIDSLQKNKIQLPYKKRPSYSNMVLEDSPPSKPANKQCLNNRQQKELNLKIYKALSIGKEQSFALKEPSKRKKCSKIKFNRLNCLKQKIQNMNAKIDNCFDRSIKKRKGFSVITKEQNSSIELFKQCYPLQNDERKVCNKFANSQRRDNSLSALIVQLKQAVKLKGRHQFLKEMLNKTAGFDHQKLQHTSCSLEHQIQPQTPHILNRSLFKVNIRGESSAINRQFPLIKNNQIRIKSQKVYWDDDLLRFKTEPNNQGFEQIYEAFTKTQSFAF